MNLDKEWSDMTQDEQIAATMSLTANLAIVVEHIEDRVSQLEYINKIAKEEF